MRFGWGVLAALVAACPDAANPPRGLHVPLPEDWGATAAGPGVLSVGPKGRGVLTLERRPAQLPPLEVLTSAVTAEQATVVRSSRSASGATVRYRGSSKEGLLLVRTLENGALLLCASTSVAEPEELDAAEVLCKAVRLEEKR